MPGSRILLISIVIALLGFPLFWLVAVPTVRGLGLFLVGLGLANMFPLTLSLAIRAADCDTNVASARLSLASGAAILLMPQLLGVIADYSGIQGAYGIVLVMLSLIPIALTIALRQSRAG